MDNVWELERSTTDAKLGGVCGALAARWNVDPTLIRIAAVILALSSGLGLVPYLAAWLLLPADDGSEPILFTRLPSTAAWPHTAWLVLVVGLTIACCATAGPALPFDLMPAVVLAGLVWLGERRRLRERDTAHLRAAGQLPPPAHTAFTVAAAAWQERVDAVLAQQAAQTAGGVPAPAAPATDAAARIPHSSGLAPVDRPAPPATAATAGWQASPAAVPTATPAVATRAETPTQHARRVRRQRRLRAKLERRARGSSPAALRLALATLVALGLAMAAVAVWQPAHGTTVALALCAVVLGVALLASARVGRVRGLMAAAIVVGILAGSSAISLAQPASPPVRPDGQELISLRPGDREVDLRRIPPGTRRLRVEATAGRTVLRVSDAQPLQIVYRVGAGEFRADGVTERNAESGTWYSNPDSDKSPVVVEIHQRVGIVEVQES